MIDETTNTAFKTNENHYKRPLMSNALHIVIIGGGLIGLTSARALLDKARAEGDLRITVIEKNAAPGLGAGFANSGMIHPSQAKPWHDDMAQTTKDQVTGDVLSLAEKSVYLVKKRLSALGLKDVNRPMGCLKYYPDIEARKRAHHDYKRMGIRTAFADHPAHSLIFPDDFSANALSWSRAEALALTDDGVKFICEVAAKLSQDKDGLILHIKDQVLRPDHILIAAGSDSCALLAPLGINVPIKAVKGYALEYNIRPLDKALFSPWLDGPPIMDAASHSALSLFGDTLRLSGTVGAHKAETLIDIWSKICPELINALGEPHLKWEGYRPICDYGRPIIGPTKIKGLWINSGHGHMGWTLSQPSGQLIANMILNGRSDPRFRLVD